MNTSISSKLSLYDILAMLIPGALIICWVSLIFCDNSLIIDKKKIDPLIFGILFSAGSYLVGIIYCKIIECIEKCIGLIDTPQRMRKSFHKTIKNINQKKINNALFNELKKISDFKEYDLEFRDLYYQAYAFVAKNTYRNTVSILESQIAFLRSMILIIPLYIPIIAKKIQEKNCCMVSIILIIITLILTIYVMYSKQKKIYEMVWEDYEYLNRVI